MTTACAIDRLVRQATILELAGNSYRAEAAQNRQAATGAPWTVTSLTPPMDRPWTSKLAHNLPTVSLDNTRSLREPPVLPTAAWTAARQGR